MYLDTAMKAAASVEDEAQQMKLYDLVLGLQPHNAEAAARAAEIRSRRAAEQPILSPRRLLDHLRLPIWALGPDKLTQHQAAFGKYYTERVARWSNSTLLWLPFLLVTLSLGAGLLPRSIVAVTPAIHLVYSALILLAGPAIAHPG